MKKTIKAIGFLAAFVLAMFLNTNAIESSKYEKFTLADAISMNSANAECPFWIPPYLCDDNDPPPGGSEDYRTNEPFETSCNGEVMGGNHCVWTMIQMYCTPYHPCA